MYKTFLMDFISLYFNLANTMLPPSMRRVSPLAIMVENCLGTYLIELNKSLLHVTCFVHQKSRYKVGYSPLILLDLFLALCSFHPPLNFLQSLLNLLS